MLHQSENFFFQVYYAERIGVSPSHASFLISIWSISSIVGRIFFGKLMHHFKKHLLRGYQIAMFGSGCVTVMAYFSNRYWMLVTYVITYGFLDGSFIGLISLATLEIVGLNKLAHGYGIMLTFIGLPIAAGPPLIGKHVYGLHFFTGIYLRKIGFASTEWS